MKKLLMLCLLGGAMFLQSCGDDCDDVTCFNGGTCDDGTCQCVEGYTGDTCEDEQRSGLIGAWIGNTICPDEPAEAGTITISEGSTVTQVLISPEGEESLTGTITGTNTFDIDPSTFTDPIFGLVVTTSGNGSINSSNQLEMNIDVEVQGFGASTCVFTGAQ